MDLADMAGPLDGANGMLMNGVEKTPLHMKAKDPSICYTAPTWPRPVARGSIEQLELVLAFANTVVESKNRKSRKGKVRSHSQSVPAEVSRNGIEQDSK